MRVSLACHLRQVGHAQDLRAVAERTQLTSDDFRHAAADTGVHFVEDEARQRVRLRGSDLDGQADARQLAARRHLRERPWRLARIRAHQELDLVRAMRVGRVGIEGAHGDFEYAALHAQRLHELTDPSRQLACCRDARGSELRARGAKLRLQLCELLFNLFERGFERIQLLKLCRELRVQRAECRGFDAMFARNGFDGSKALFHPLLPLRVCFQIRLVALGRLDALAQCDQAFVDRFGDRDETRIELRQRT